MSYDPAGNVSALSTTLPQGTDNQAFCYDAQNRLTWAGTTTGNPCGNPAPTGSFGAASYTQSFTYDALNRLTSGPQGSYTYGESAHLHAATSVSGGYTATYDAAGDMLCRAPSSATTCAGGSPTGQQLTWDVEGRLAAWQNTPTSPTTTASYLYDGEGNRVVQQVTDTTTGTTTTTSYIGRLQTVTHAGATTTTTDYIPAGSVLAESVNGTLSYLATSYQGSVVEALDSSGTVTASQLYAPYGEVRYRSGGMPTDYGYTGQRSDATTGLDYYGARYYDPLLGQFTSADTLLAGGLNRYAYVGGNPTTATDPSGHMDEEDPEDGGATGVEGAPAGSLGMGVGDLAPTDPTVVNDGVPSPLAATADDSVTLVDETTGIKTTFNGSEDDETVTITYPDGRTKTIPRSEYEKTNPTASLETTEIGESAYNDLRAQEQDNQPTSTTPTTDTPNSPQSPKTPENPGSDGPTTPSSSNQLPNQDQAKIDPNKFENYSMNPDNPNSMGKWKAFKQVGYDVQTPQGRATGAQDVMKQLRGGLENSPAESLGDTRGYGQRWQTRTPIVGPNGGQGSLVGIWQIEGGIPRLISNWLEVW